MQSDSAGNHTLSRRELLATLAVSGFITFNITPRLVGRGTDFSDKELYRNMDWSFVSWNDENRLQVSVDTSDIPHDEMELEVDVRRYSDGVVLDRHSESVRVDDSSTAVVKELDLKSAVTANTPCAAFGYVSLPNSDVRRYFGETDPVVRDGESLHIADPPEPVSSTPGHGINRVIDPGVFRLHYDHMHLDATLEIGKSDYKEAGEGMRWDNHTYDDAVVNPYARRLTRKVIDDEADERQQFREVVSFCQQFPNSYDWEEYDSIEYAKYVEETLVDGQGDCEDIAAVLVGMLAQEPFEYDTAFVFVPGHVGVGVAADDVPADVEDADLITVGDTEYVYVESTAPKPLGVGEIYDGSNVTAIYDGSWSSVRPLNFLTTLPDAIQMIVSAYR